MPHKIAVSGKGGVGKTTLAAGLCLALADRAHEVLALDCDPDSNLADALGFPAEQRAAIKPLSTLADLVEERTGARPGTMGAMFKLNPHVADIPDTYCHRLGPIRLLAAQGAAQGGGGCDCAENTLVRRVVNHVVVRRGEAVVMDMEAGLEHLGRATVGAVTALVVVVEPGRRSLGTAERIVAMAGDLGVPACWVVGSRFASDDEARAFVAPLLSGVARWLGHLPHDPGIAAADRLGSGIAQTMSDDSRGRFAAMLDTLCDNDPNPDEETPRAL